MARRPSAVGQLTTAANVVAPRRGRRPSITREEVLGAALGVVDRDGLAALTMRDLAGHLGVAVGTVYSAAGGKEEILQGVADLVLGELPAIAVVDRDWKVALVTFFKAVHQLFVAHPAIAQLSVLEPLVGPGVLAGHDAVFGIMTAAGLDQAEAMTLYATLASYTTGFSLYQISRRSPGAAGAAPVLLGRTSPYLEIPLTDAQFETGLVQIVRGFSPPVPSGR
jgi:AcrR family transcriptional regulator